MDLLFLKKGGDYLSDNKKIHFDLGKDALEKVDCIAERLSTTRSNIVRLLINLNKQNVILTKEEVEKYSNRKDLIKTQISVRGNIFRLFDIDTVNAYFFQANERNVYLSAFLEKAIINSDLCKDVEVSKKGTTSLVVNSTLVNKLVKIQAETGITKTCVVNYAMTLNIEDQLFLDTNEKTIVGFQLSKEHREQLKAESKAANVSTGEILEMRVDNVMEKMRL